MANSENSDRYLILLEEIRGHVKLLAEAHEHFDGKLESYREHNEAHMQALRADISSMEQRLYHRFDRLEIKIDRNTNDIRVLNATVDRHSHTIDELKAH